MRLYQSERERRIKKDKSLAALHFPSRGVCIVLFPWVVPTARLPRRLGHWTWWLLNSDSIRALRPAKVCHLTPVLPKNHLPCCVFASRLRVFSGLGRWTHSVCPFTYPPLIILSAFCFLAVSLRPFCFLSLVSFCLSAPVCYKLCVQFLLLFVNTCTYIDLIVMWRCLFDRLEVTV